MTNLSELRYFPVLDTGHGGMAMVPWLMADAARARIERAHGGRTLEQLASNGGLDAVELVAAFDNHQTIELGSGVKASQRLVALVKGWEAAR